MRDRTKHQMYLWQKKGTPDNSIAQIPRCTLPNLAPNVSLRQKKEFQCPDLDVLSTKCISTKKRQSKEFQGPDPDVPSTKYISAVEKEKIKFKEFQCPDPGRLPTPLQCTDMATDGPFGAPSLVFDGR